tara:strand:+ start:719 stop:901 length:183 start_codon:yes stop_codon:yes gene_type:complete
MKYFESDSVKGLYQVMQEWEETNGRVSDEGTRFFEQIASVNIQKDGDFFTCIAMTKSVIG